MTSPISFLREAIKAVPAVQYALGIGGIVAVIAIIGAFGIEPKVGVFGTVVMLLMMGVLVIFARMTATAGKRLHAPAMVFTWFSLAMFMLVSISLFTSVFFKMPVDLSCWLSNSVICGGTIPEPVRAGDRFRLDVDDITYGAKSSGTDYATAKLSIESIGDERILVEYVGLVMHARLKSGKSLISHSITLIEDRSLVSGETEEGTMEAANGVYWIDMGQPAPTPTVSQIANVSFEIEARVQFPDSGKNVMLSVIVPSAVPDTTCGHPCLRAYDLKIPAGSSSMKVCQVYPPRPPSRKWVYDCKIPAPA